MDVNRDKVLNHPISAVYTATFVFVEFMERYGILYNNEQLEQICRGFSFMPLNKKVLSDKSDGELEEILFGLLTENIDLDSRKKSGSERTPEAIIDYMLDLIDYNGEKITNKIIIDPACGTGTFSAKIIGRFISALDKHADIEIIKTKLLKNRLIQAYDTNPSNVYITKIVLLSILIRNKAVYKIQDILELLQNLPVMCEDFLKVKDKADYIIGNPPYIRLQNMCSEYREFIKKHFASSTGRFDIYTCFIENSDRLLNENGRMCLITSNKYLTANYGAGLRDYLYKKKHVRKIVDLFDTRFFNAAVLPAIIMCENSVPDSDFVEYTGVKSSVRGAQTSCFDMKELFFYIENDMKKNECIIQYGTESDVSFEVSRSKVMIPESGRTWNFSSEQENHIKEKLETKKYCELGDIFDICVGIKTTADTVFVKPMTEKFVKEKNFESEVIYPLIQSFNVDKWSITWGNSSKDRYILYPHKEEQGTMSAISLEDIPHTKKYLEEHADILKRRPYLAESKTREWYECWVPQKLSKFRQLKLVTRDIVSHNSFAYDDSGKLCQGNTFFLTEKQSIFSMRYELMAEKKYYLFVLGMLNSKVMEYYQKMISGCLYSQKYRYTTTNLKRWPVPNIEQKTAIEIANLVEHILNKRGSQRINEKMIDKIMYKEFGLTEEEIQKIENFIRVGIQE